MVITAIRYPNIEIGLTAQTKENAASLLKDKYNELVRYYPMLLNEIKQKHPELRICQILSIAASKSGWSNYDLFYLPDEKLLSALEILNKELS